MTATGRMRLKGHAARLSVERDPDEGNFWTAECECGEMLPEYASTREIARDEHRFHVIRERRKLALRNHLQLVVEEGVRG